MKKNIPFFHYYVLYTKSENKFDSINVQVNLMNVDEFLKCAFDNLGNIDAAEAFINGPSDDGFFKWTNSSRLIINFGTVDTPLVTQFGLT